MVLRLLFVAFFCATLLHAEESPSTHGRVHAEMRNIVYHYTKAITVHIVHLEGELVPTEQAGLPVFEDPNSFFMDIRSAELTISTAALADILNQYAFASANAPIKAIRVSSSGERLTIEGRLRKGDVPFESAGSLAVTSDGEIRVHTEKIKALHLPVKGLMDLLGENIAKLINMKQVRGIRAEGDDLILSPSELFPPPHIRGKITSITIRGNEITQKYGGPPEPTIQMSGNYMAYRGARLQFGKLTMNDTDLTLIDLDPQDPLDFYLDYYWGQLAAGYSKITPSFGLVSYFRDYNKLTPRQRIRTRK